MAELERTDLHVSRGAAVEEEDAGLARGSPDQIGIAWHTGHCQHKAAQLVAAHHVRVRACDVACRLHGMQASLCALRASGVRTPQHKCRSASLRVRLARLPRPSALTSPQGARHASRLALDGRERVIQGDAVRPRLHCTCALMIALLCPTT